MSTPNAADSPIVNSPIINSPMVSSAIIGNPISASSEPEYEDFSSACAATMPAGSRVFYFKFVFILFAVAGSVLFALFKFCEYMGWFN